MTIWKYPLDSPPFADSWELDIPAGAQFLSVQTQNGTPTLWALVDTSKSPLRYTITRYGTGWEIPDATGSHEHISTVIRGDFVWHFFVDGGK